MSFRPLGHGVGFLVAFPPHLGHTVFTHSVTLASGEEASSAGVKSSLGQLQRQVLFVHGHLSALPQLIMGMGSPNTLAVKGPIFHFVIGLGRSYALLAHISYHGFNGLGHVHAVEEAQFTISPPSFDT